MLLKRSIDRTKNFLNRTVQDLKAILFGGYKKLPKVTSFNPFSRSSRNHQDHDQLDQFYTDFIDGLESDQVSAKRRENKNVMSMREAMKEEDNSKSFLNYSARSPVKMQENGGKEEKKMVNSHAGRRRSGQPCLQSKNEGSFLLAQKMKELEMVDVGNVDHVLDVEEVLHYYSRLRSPVYLDIVDNFFVDMYSEFLHSQPSVSMSNSKQRLGPLKLYKS